MEDDLGIPELVPDKSFSINSPRRGLLLMEGNGSWQPFKFSDLVFSAGGLVNWPDKFRKKNMYQVIT